MRRIIDLRAAGASDQEIRGVRRESSRLAAGVYDDQGLEPWPKYRRRCEAVVSRLKPGATLAGPSAAVLWNLPLVGSPPSIVFVSNVTRGRYGKDMRILPDCAPVEHEGLLLASPADVVTQCAALLSSRDALIVADAALAAGLVTQQQLTEHVATMRGRHRAERMRWIVQHADGRAESPGETWTRHVVTQLGYDVIPQFAVQHADRRARIDLVVAGTMTGIEFDGAEKYERHGGEVIREHLREADLQELGYALVRLLWIQVPDHQKLDRRLRATGAAPVRRPHFLTW